MREVLNMNFDWQFHDGDIENTSFDSIHEIFGNPIFLKSGNCGISKVGYNLNEWDNVQIPHDLRHYRCDFNPSVVSAQGFLSTGIGWYRKEFFISEKEEGKSITIDFDGVFRDSEVYVNGHYVGKHLSGYTSFQYELSDFILYGENNAIAVRVDGTKFEGWWYEAVGIYRDVRLIITDKLKIRQDGIWITYDIEGDSANISLDIELENEDVKTGEATVLVAIYNPLGQQIKHLTTPIEVLAYKEQKVSVKAQIENIMLWDLDAPNQYRADVSIMYEGKEIDTYSQKFGLRTIKCTSDKGFFLNGKATKIHGVCIHDDFAGVGGAMSRAVIRHKVFLLKQWGCNAYRTSHNPPSPYVLEACDDFGILVMDEVRLMSSSKEYLAQMTDLIKRDRNHPCIFMWSIGNEEMAIHGTKTAVKIVNHMLRIAHELDPTRLCTYANNCDWRDITDFHEENGLNIDVFGFNYYCKRTFDAYEYIHNKYPNTMIIGTENGSVISTRGQYLPREEELNPDYYSKSSKYIMIWSNPDRMYNASAYGEAYTVWGATSLETLKAADPDYVAGYFHWTGFDYRGEVIPFDWPSVVSRFGLMDLCGFMKDTGHHYRIKWAKEPSVYLYPHWTFDANVGMIQVDVVANTEEVELFVNGKSQGRKLNPLRDVVKYEVIYEKGEITARAYNKGAVVATMTHQTAGIPYEIHLETIQERKYIADGEDNIFVKVEVLDQEGRHCPNANHFIEFFVEGEGTFLGAGNGDPLSMENDRHPNRKLFNGLALAILRTTRETGKIRLIAQSKELLPASLEIEVTVDASNQLVMQPRDDRAIVRRVEKDDADDAF